MEFCSPRMFQSVRHPFRVREVFWLCDPGVVAALLDLRLLAVTAPR